MKYAQGVKRSLKKHFTAKGFKRLEELLQTLSATLPHASLSVWSRHKEAAESAARLKGSTGNKKLGITIGYTSRNDVRFCLKSELSKGRAFGIYEREFAKCLVREIKAAVDILIKAPEHQLLAGPQEIIDATVSTFLRKITGLNDPDFLGIIKYLKELAQQSYETKSIAYGILVLPRRFSVKPVAIFPEDVLMQKRFQAVTDGFKTALTLDRTGKVIRLQGLKQDKKKVGEHYRPAWLDPMAETAQAHNAIGIALTRTGSILVAWNGNLILSYRLGGWVLWSHSENVEIIRDALKFKGKPQRAIGHLAAKLYRCALDTSFRKTGGLFVALTSERHLGRLVPTLEQLRGKRRTGGDQALGQWLEKKSMIGIDREVLSDLAALDGAIVCDRAGKILS